MGGSGYAATGLWGWRQCGGSAGREERWAADLERAARQVANWWVEMGGGRSEGRRGHGESPHGGHRRRGGPESWGSDWFMPFGPRPGGAGPGWGGPGWGRPGWAGPGWGGPSRRPGKARRGDVRAAILSVLQDTDLNGYQMIQEIEERSGGAWKPSPGSVYPTLQQLEDEGLVVAGAPDGRRTYRLTEEGRSYAEEHADELAAPWRAFSQSPDEDVDEHGVKPVVGQLMGALWQIMATGTPEQQSAAREALGDLRKTLFQILAEGDEERSS